MRNGAATWAIAVLLLSTGLNVIGITWGLPSMLGWAADELTPVRVLSGMGQGFARGWHDPYPAFHFYVLAAAYSHVLAVDARPLADVGSSETGWRRQRGDGGYLALFIAMFFSALLWAREPCGRQRTSPGHLLAETRLG